MRMSQSVKTILVKKTESIEELEYKFRIMLHIAPLEGTQLFEILKDVAESMAFDYKELLINCIIKKQQRNK